MGPIARKTGAAVFTAAILATFMQVASQTYALSMKHDDFLAPPPLSNLTPSAIDVLTLGFRPVYDDFVQIWTVQYLFDAKIDGYPLRQVYKTLKTTAAHHPKSAGFYLSACFYLAFNRERPQLCEPIIIDGMKALPNEWRLPATQGFLEAFKMNNVSKAIAYYGMAANLPGHPPFMEKAIGSLQELGKIDTQMLNETLLQIAGDRNQSQIAEFITRVIDKSARQNQRLEEQEP